MESKLTLNKDSVVLDLGCGLGVNSVWLAETFDCKVIGLDISGEMIEYCKKELGPATIKQYVEKGVPYCDKSTGKILRKKVSQAEAEKRVAELVKEKMVFVVQKVIHIKKRFRNDLKFWFNGELPFAICIEKVGK